MVEREGGARRVGAAWPLRGGAARVASRGGAMLLAASGWPRGARLVLLLLLSLTFASTLELLAINRSVQDAPEAAGEAPAADRLRAESPGAVYEVAADSTAPDAERPAEGPAEAEGPADADEPAESAAGEQAEELELAIASEQTSLWWPPPPRSPPPLPSLPPTLPPNVLSSVPPSHRGDGNWTKVALLADSALNRASERVLALVAQEGADVVLHPGDIDYTGRLDLWQGQVSAALGPRFPYFYSAGNYENKDTPRRKNVAWQRYVAHRRQRLRDAGAVCVHESADGAQVACHWRGVSFVLSNLSNLKARVASDLQFVRTSLSRLRAGFPRTRWTFCLWHAPFHLMQVSFRTPPSVLRSEQLERAYEACRKDGAVVVSGHEHYYLRTHLVESFVQPYLFRRPEAAAEQVPTLALRPGASFAVVSGLGGHSLSVPSLDAFSAGEHLAVCHPHHMLTRVDPGGKLVFPELSGAVPTSSSVLEGRVDAHGYPFGALFCDLPLAQTSPDEFRAACYFKTVDNVVVDRFDMTSELVAGAGVSAAAAITARHEPWT